MATAEKLDLLFRQEPGLADRLAVVIVDEAHLLHQRDRGLGLEFLTGRLRRRAPKARVLLMSAVLPNVEDIGRWLEPEAAGLNVIKEQWTPSRLVTGIFHWERGRPAIGQTGTVRYPGDEFFLPSVLRRERRTNRVDSTPYPKNKNEDAAELALHYERLGPVLIGVATKPHCEWVAASLERALARPTPARSATLALPPGQDAERQALADLIAETAGRNHPLVNYVRAGYGYHHADLPDEARRGLERAFRSGALRILVATSTLSQGVNLPAHTVIIAYVQRGATLDTLIPVREFANLAGRAGRAFTETEGHVVLIAKDEHEARRLKRRYLRSHPEKVESVLYQLYRQLLAQRLPSIPHERLPANTDLADAASHVEPRLLEPLDAQLLVLAAED
ncbi:MAG: DEAD/DEAH box helicase, partial [bacterium]